LSSESKAESTTFAIAGGAASAEAGGGAGGAATVICDFCERACLAAEKFTESTLLGAAAREQAASQRAIGMGAFRREHSAHEPGDRCAEHREACCRRFQHHLKVRVPIMQARNDVHCEVATGLQFGQPMQPGNTKYAMTRVTPKNSCLTQEQSSGWVSFAR
jgi:hypothetical protein